MKPWESIAGDFSQGKREAKEGEYSIVAAGGVGRVVCTVPGVQLIDFYRTTTLLSNNLVPSGAAGVAGVTHTPVHKDTPKKEDK